MKIYYKFSIVLFLLPVCVLLFWVSKKSDAAIISKTVVFFAGQDDLLKVDGGIFSYPLVVTIPENLPAIKNAHIEISGISFNSPPQNQTVYADLQGGLISSPKTFTFFVNARSQQFNLNYDVTPIIHPSSNTYTLNITGGATGGTFSIFSAKLVLSYEYDSIQSSLLKTSVFFVGQENAKTPANNVISKNFSIAIPESSLSVKNAFIEISGTFKDSGQGTIETGLFDAGAPIGYKKFYNFDLGPQTSSAKFFLRYDALADINVSNNNYTLHFKASKAINVWSARLYLTYQYSESGTYPETGFVISSTFDTRIEKGAAYNSIMWNGSLNSGNVKLQLATSDCANGKTNPPLCNDSGTWTYLGPDQGLGCLDTNYYIEAAGVPQEIKCYSNHNNKRFFRYKIILCSDPSCAIRGPNNPLVNNVIVNWAP